jgi:hypothetical protein
MKTIDFDLNGKIWTATGTSDNICISWGDYMVPDHYEWVWLSHPTIIGVLDEEGTNFCDAGEEAEALTYCYEHPDLFEL